MDIRARVEKSTRRRMERRYFASWRPGIAIPAMVLFAKRRYILSSVEPKIRIRWSNLRGQQSRKIQVRKKITSYCREKSREEREKRHTGPRIK
jgi:hypothetical protein